MSLIKKKIVLIREKITGLEFTENPNNRGFTIHVYSEGCNEAYIGVKTQENCEKYFNSLCDFIASDEKMLMIENNNEIVDFVSMFYKFDSEE